MVLGEVFVKATYVTAPKAAGIVEEDQKSYS